MDAGSHDCKGVPAILDIENVLEFVEDDADFAMCGLGHKLCQMALYQIAQHMLAQALATVKVSSDAGGLTR